MRQCRFPRNWQAFTSETALPNAFVQKLSGYVSLTAEDTRLLTEACAVQRDVPPGYDLIREGDKPVSVFVMLEGWACRYKLLPEGGRQITAFLMPGDFCDMHVAVLDQMVRWLGLFEQARAFVKWSVCRFHAAARSGWLK
jgi:CRP-like cAMP-binding protein